MKAIKLFLVIALPLVPTVASAQSLTPEMNQQFDYCQDRPLEPKWMDNLPVRENYKRLVVQTIYRAQGLERVIEAGECSCATRFPSWDTAVQHFNDNYLGADRHTLREAEDRYLSQFNRLRETAREICDAEGNW